MQHVQTHIERVHKEQKEVVCEVCNKTFKNVFSYQSHKKRAHEAKNLKHQCEECDRKCYNKSELKLHQDSVHRGVTHSCQLCSKTFAFKEGLQKHLLLAHGSEEEKKRFPCPQCSRAYPLERLLRHHINISHNKTRNFLCTSCGKRFLTPGELRIHMNIHLGMKPHVCQDCGKGFSAKYNLRQHRVVHTKEKWYRCKYCDKGFSQHTSMQIHVKGVHEEDLRHECSVCNKKFVFRAQLNTHLKTHGVYDETASS